MMRRPHRIILPGAALALGTALVVALGGSGATPATASDRPADAQATELATDGQPVAAGGVVYGPGEPAARRAAELAGQVPLPPGEAFDDIDWDNGELSDLDIRGLLEMNAACKWWLANADHPTPETADVVAAIPSWPTLRTGERHRIVAAMAEPEPSAFAVELLAACRRAVR